MSCILIFDKKGNYTLKKDMIIGKIDSIEWTGGTLLSVEGYCYVNGVHQSENKSVKKSLLLENNEKKYLLPMDNVIRTDVLKENDKLNHRFCGFKGSVDLAFIDNMDSLSVGYWSVKVVLIVGDIETEVQPEFIGDIKIESKKFRNISQKNIVSIKPIIKDNCLYLSSTKISRLRLSLKDSIPLKILYKGLHSFMVSIKKALSIQLFNLFKLMPMKKDTVLFLSDSRADMSGNFKFVYDEINRRGRYNIKSYLKDTNKQYSLIDNIKLLYAIATSKYVLLDDFYPLVYDFKFRKEANLVQLWHACGAFKTFGYSRLGKEGGPHIRSRNHRNYTKAIVSSEAIRKHYAEGFGISNDKVIATGVPRTDVFFDEKYKQDKEYELKQKYPLLNNKKVIMFAPTFRGNGKGSAYYDFDKLDIEKMYKELSDEYVVIMKIHPFVKDVPKIDGKYKDFIIDLSAEREINDLLFVSDILITDYSSVIFEFSLLNRPIIMFAYDMDDYIEKRDFYYPYKDFVPGVIAKNIDEVISTIKEEKFCTDKLQNFRQRFFSHTDGKSTKRVVDMILGQEK